MTEGVNAGRQWHRGTLPAHSTLLTGRTPPDDTGFQSERLQVWYNNTTEAWTDPAPHFHRNSDEVFIVLRGSLQVEVEGSAVTIRPSEFCCFLAGVTQAVVAVPRPPLPR